MGHQACASDSAFAPAQWALDVQDAIVFAEKSKRFSAPQGNAILKRLAAMPVSIDSAGRFGGELEISRKHGVAIYDAVYLDLAIRRNVPLATRDKKLSGVAKKMGITLL